MTIIVKIGIILAPLLLAGGILGKEDSQITAGLAVMFLAGIYGIVCYRVKRNGWFYTSIVYAAIVGFLLIMSVTTSHGHPPSKKLVCAAHLKQIGLALRQYAMDYHDFFPPDNGKTGLTYLRQKGYLTEQIVFQCPAIAGKSDRMRDYEYRGGLKDTEANADLPLAWDKDGNHKEFVNVLFCDGHVSGMQQKEFDALRKKYPEMQKLD